MLGVLGVAEEATYLLTVCGIDKNKGLRPLIFADEQ